MLTPSSGFCAAPLTTLGAAMCPASRDGRYDVDDVVELRAEFTLGP